jgi:hypothetical protein
MTIKIDAPQGWYDADVDLPRRIAVYYFGKRVWKDQAKARIVRESDWRRIMSVVRAADNQAGHSSVEGSLMALRKHLEKKQ